MQVQAQSVSFLNLGQIMQMFSTVTVRQQYWKYEKLL